MNKPITEEKKVSDRIKKWAKTHVGISCKECGSRFNVLYQWIFKNGLKQWCCEDCYETHTNEIGKYNTTKKVLEDLYKMSQSDECPFNLTYGQIEDYAKSKGINL